MEDLLFRIKSSDLEIKTLIDLRDSMKENVLSINSNISEKVSGSKNLDGIYNIVDKYVDLENIIQTKLESLLEDKKIALKLISNLNNSIDRIILIERYFNNKSWRSIASIINKSEKWTRHLHSKVLEKIAP